MLRISCVHGVGRHPAGGAWERRWEGEIRSAMAEVSPDEEIAIEFVHYDSIFEAADLSYLDVMQAVAKLTSSAVGGLFRRQRGVSGTVRWTAGMVVQWVESSSLRRRTRRMIEAHVGDFDPHVIVAHSLGSLICYDTFTDSPQTIAGRTFVSCGSQIGNPFVVGSFAGGYITPLHEAKHWYHLYNEEDAVFTAPLRLHAENFTQVDTYFDESGIADHSATRYLSHPAAVEHVWGDVVVQKTQPDLFARRREPSIAWSTAPRRRALLVGINDYPDPAMRLEGCVNDVFLMSSLLQEVGFAAEDIRVVLDDRATTDGILERLEWLLDGVEGEGERVFYFSGHGAQLPTYGLGDRVDRMDEALVSWDFDWSPETALTDDRFYDLYSQLPHGARFLTVLDCCHSGGMTRAGGPRIRGVNPPDDIRHRAMRWDTDHAMWVPRELGEGGRGGEGLRRLGYCDELRPLTRAAMRRRRKARNHLGPFMPVLLYACDEAEFAYEYRHGATSYGAFTYALVKRFRELAASGAEASMENLVDFVAGELEALEFDQHPRAEGPEVRLEEPMPYLRGLDD